MARKKVREYDAKRMLKQHMLRLCGVELPINVAQVKANTNFVELAQQHPWLTQTELVVKPDMLFGQRGKHDLVGLKLDLSGAEQFIKDRMNKVITVKECTGPITTFIVEPFVPHAEEYYLCIQSKRLECEISFCPAGGVDIEENWDKLTAVSVPTGAAISADLLAPLLSGVPLEMRPQLQEFVRNVFAFFEDLDCTLLEMNPFTLDGAGRPFPLDMRLELDDTAGFRSAGKWGDVEFPLPFGRVLSSAEQYIHNLDEQTGASLKFTVLNSRGRVWPMVAGGGASVIYADTVADLGFAPELGNYGEYSGAPNTNETYQYARTLLDCATAGPDGQPRALLIGGGIANFTDVAATFKGIIQALRERADALRACNMHIFVRRGGPNYQSGLAAMRALGEELGVPIAVYGPETSMTGICQQAIQVIRAAA